MWILQDGLHGHLSISGTMWRSCVLVQVRLLPLLILSLITIFIYISHFFSHRWVPVFVITGIVAWSYYAYVAELCIKNVESDAVKVWYLYMYVFVHQKLFIYLSSSQVHNCFHNISIDCSGRLLDRLPHRSHSLPGKLLENCVDSSRFFFNFLCERKRKRNIFALQEIFRKDFVWHLTSLIQWKEVTMLRWSLALKQEMWNQWLW